MSVSFRKNRALNLILRNKFHAAAHNEPPVSLQEPSIANNAPTYELSADIPESYNDAYVRAIPIDPQNTFVYWEVPQEQAVCSGVPTKGNIHTENDKAAWIQEKLCGDSENQQRHQSSHNLHYDTQGWREYHNHDNDNVNGNNHRVDDFIECQNNNSHENGGSGIDDFNCVRLDDSHHESSDYHDDDFNRVWQNNRPCREENQFDRISDNISEPIIPLTLDILISQDAAIRRNSMQTSHSSGIFYNVNAKKIA